GAQDDGALLAHRVVARDIRPRAVVERGQGSGLRVAALDRPVVRAAVDDGGGVPVVDRRVVGVVARVDSGEQAVLQVRVDPRAVAGAVAPYPDVAEGDRFHGAVAVVAAVGLGVAVVEAAAAVVVRAVEDGVLALGVVTGRRAGRGVVPVAGARRDVDPVGLVAVERGRRGGRVGQVVRAGRGAARRGLSQVVVVPGLVVDYGDHAAGAGAERVLRRGVGVSVDHADVARAVVRRAAHLVQRAGVRGVQRP